MAQPKNINKKIEKKDIKRRRCDYIKIWIKLNLLASFLIPILSMVFHLIVSDGEMFKLQETTSNILQALISLLFTSLIYAYTGNFSKEERGNIITNHIFALIISVLLYHSFCGDMTVGWSANTIVKVGLFCAAAVVYFVCFIWCGKNEYENYDPK